MFYIIANIHINIPYDNKNLFYLLLCGEPVLMFAWYQTMMFLVPLRRSDLTWGRNVPWKVIFGGYSFHYLSREFEKYCCCDCCLCLYWYCNYYDSFYYFCYYFGYYEDEALSFQIAVVIRIQYFVLGRQYLLEKKGWFEHYCCWTISVVREKQLLACNRIPEERR